jgi:single-strand DNA-binding protein
MASVCKVHLVGNIGKDPEVRYSAAGKPITNASLATTSKRKNKEGEMVETTEWHKLTFFDKLAEIVGEYVKKGSLIYVEGTIKYEKFINKNGVEVNTTQIICNEMTILKRAENKVENKPEHYEGLPKLDDDDLPF